nr:hypothetical protein [Marinobacter halotolerans]
MSPMILPAGQNNLNQPIEFLHRVSLRNTLESWHYRHAVTLVYSMASRALFFFGQLHSGHAMGVGDG